MKPETDMNPETTAKMKPSKQIQHASGRDPICSIVPHSRNRTLCALAAIGLAIAAGGLPVGATCYETIFDGSTTPTFNSCVVHLGQAVGQCQRYTQPATIKCKQTSAGKEDCAPATAQTQVTVQTAACVLNSQNQAVCPAQYSGQQSATVTVSGNGAVGAPCGGEGEAPE